MSKVWLALSVATLALLLRLPNLGQFMTVDEQNWMIRSAEFYDVLLAGNPGGTFMTTHPGSTIMWLVGGGETLQELRLGFEVDTDNLFHFRKAAVFPVVLAISLVAGLIAWLLAKLWGVRAALMASILLIADPYLVGHSQVAHLDMLQAVLMLASLVSILVYVTKAQQIRYLAVAGVAWGLALGIKMVLAMWILPVVIGVVILNKVGWRKSFQMMGVLVGVAGLTIWLSWPALWFKDDVAQSFTRDVATIITDEHVALSYSDDPISPASFYLRTWLGRVPPHVQVLSIGSLVVLGQLWKHRKKQEFNNLLVLIIYSLGFLFGITLAAKKGDRYSLPGLIVWSVIAGWTLSWALEVAKSKWNLKEKSEGLIRKAVLLAVVALPVFTPYNLAYNNPLFPNVRPFSQQGWGEGLDAAAKWLNENPLGENLTVASWYPSVMRTYFRGKTFSLSSRDDYRVGYVVTYRNMRGRAPDTQASNVLDEFKDKEPVHIVKVNGVEYAWIYETLSVGNYTKHVGEVISGVEVGQSFVSESDSLSGIEIGFATFSSRDNQQDVILQVKNEVGGEILRSVTVNAQEIIDNEWQLFEFDETLSGIAGQELFISITSPRSTAGDAVTVRYIDADVASGQMFFRENFREADIAYRLVK